MKIDPGSTVIYEEDGSLKSGIFVGFTDISEKKAMIFPENKIIATEKLIPATLMQLKVLLDKIECQRKQWRREKRESSEE